MNKIHFIKNQKLATKVNKYVVKGEGWRKRKIVDVNNINLQLIPTTYKKTCIVLLEVNNEYWYSETFDKFIKSIGKTKAEAILDFIQVVYGDKLENVYIGTINSNYTISDWGKVKVIEELDICSECGKKAVDSKEVGTGEGYKTIHTCTECGYEQCFP
jgi:hypothetical protein